MTKHRIPPPFNERPCHEDDSRPDARGIADRLRPVRPTETVETLAAYPERRRELRQQCRLDRVKLGDELCNRVAEATSKRFYGDGKVPYTPPEMPPKF